MNKMGLKKIIKEKMVLITDGICNVIFATKNDITNNVITKTLKE